MITVKQILEQYSLATDKATADEIKLAELSDAGLFESSKLPMIKRSLNKNVNEMTEAEKKTLKYLLESLMTHVLIEKNQKVDKSAYPSDKDMPTVIILKRKAIRVFPDNQKIGLYYSQALDRYISIPFGPNVKDLSPQLNEAKEERISIADMNQQLANKWEKSSPEKRTSIAGKLSPTQRSQVSGGNRAALNYIAASNASGSVKAGAALGLGLRALIDKARGVRAMKAQPETQPESTPKPKSQTEPVSKPNVPVAQRSGATMSRSMSNRKISESFKNNLQTIREEKQLDEDWKEKATAVGDFVAPGIMNVGRSIKKGEVPSLSDVGSAALDVGTVAAGVATGGIGAAAIRGGRAAVQAAKYAKKGEKLSAAYSAAKKGFQRSKGWAVTKGIGRGVKNVAKGALGLASSLSDIDDPFKPTEENRPDFGASLKTTTVGAPTRIGQSAGDVAALTQVTKRGGFAPSSGTPFNESNNLNTFKQIVKNNIPSHTIQIGEETITINKSIAKKVVKLHESLNRTNRNKLERMLNEDITSLTKVINFAIKQ